MRSIALAALLLSGCPVTVEQEQAPKPGSARSEGNATTVASPATGPETGPEAGSVSSAEREGDPATPNGSPARAPSENAAPDPTGADSALSSVPIRLDINPPEEAPPQFSQDALARVSHVRFSGTARCDGCTERLVLRVSLFRDPSSLTQSEPAGPLTWLPLSGSGAFNMLVPRGDQPVVVELLVDASEDGQPDRGERMAVVVSDGALIPSEDRAGFMLDATDILVDPSMVGVGGSGS